ncbi:MAG: GNAT family N-acetyltransferase [Gammaproteobacteria bacterium]|nr:GNAT family N-acetyltransferase [Gammaproteobacteria bacterium]
MSGRTVGFIATFAIPIVLARLFSQSEFGTYKQIFLVFGTLFMIGQIGMAESLYYFIPSSRRSGGGFIANALAVLAVAGMALLALLWLNAQRIAGWLNNPELAGYLPYVGVFLLLMLMSAVLEITMIAREHHRLASGVYAVSDVARAALFVVPALVLHSLTALMVGAIAFAAFRLAAAGLYLRKQYAGNFGFDPLKFKQHLAYALPFGMAVVIQVVQAQFAMYYVSSQFDAATFAIFAVGCLQIPLTQFLAVSTSSVMMVRMKETLNDGKASEALEIWRDTTRKLTLIFAGLAGVLVVSAHALIVTLYTATYAKSVPIFEVACIGIVLAGLLTAGVMRVYAQTKFLIVLKLVKLGVIAGTIVFLMHWLGLIGAVLAMLAAGLAELLLSLWRSKKVMRCAFREVLPWKSLAGIVGIAIVAALPALAVRLYVELPLVAMLFLLPAVYIPVYLALAWNFGPMHQGEKTRIVRKLQRSRAAVGMRLASLGWPVVRHLLYPGRRQLWYSLELSRPRAAVAEPLPGIEVLQCNPASVAAVPRSIRSGVLRGWYRLTRAEAELWIARKGETAVASVWVFRDRTPEIAAPGGWLSLPPGHACLEDAVTAPQYRGRGIAAGLWDRVIATLSSQGVATVLFRVDEHNRSAIRAAEKVGFRPLATMERKRGWLRSRVEFSGRGGASVPGFLIEQLAR